MALAATTQNLSLGGSASLSVVRTWLYCLAGLVILMVAVGGATRLTGSGLSITEWKPITGAIPPLSEAAWLSEFEKYRQISQYELLNKGMSLQAFRFIYMWEWSHRQLGRLIGLVFFLPLVWFWLRGAITRGTAFALLGVGALGGLQAGIGWIMVASGLEPGMVAVAPIKLALHLTVAALILGLLVWIAGGLRPSDSAALKTPKPIASRLLVGLITFQIVLGGLVAGSKAGFTYNTWPLMDGSFLPPASILFTVRPLIENFVDNLALVQLNHRLVAYMVVGVALWHALAMRRRRPGSKSALRAAALVSLSVAQMVLGIATLILAVPLWAGLAHQILAMLLLATAVHHLRLV